MNLRNDAIDFDHLDEAGSTNDSIYRFEIIMAAPHQFATSLGGVDFHPEMLIAQFDAAPGHLAYGVNADTAANLSANPNRYESASSGSLRRSSR